jgi:hypothetical protein
VDAIQTSDFVDRRRARAAEPAAGVERRQFADSRDGLCPDVRELAEAIDAFKRSHQRRYITLAEVLGVVKSLGYHK